MKKITIPLLFLLSWTFVLAQKTIDAGPDKTVSLCPPSCDTLKATVISKKGTDDYKLDTIPYAPMKFDTGTGIIFNDMPIGFTFCFFGEPYTRFYVGPGWIGFSPGQPRPLWFFSVAAIPDTNNSIVPRNVIMASWYGFLPQASRVKYTLYGTAPFRKLVVSFYEVQPYFTVCNRIHNIKYYTGQIIIYETTNVIEVFTKEREDCNGVQGLHNKTGTKAIPVPGRNNTYWGLVQNDGRRFTPNSVNVSYKINWYQTDTTKLIAADTAKVKVCPTVQTSYIARVIYQTCPVDTFYDTVAVKVSGGGFPAKATVKSPPTCGQANGSILITVTGGSANYIYEVKDSTNKKTVSGPSAPLAATTYTASNLATGKYYTTATDSKGCVGLDSIVLTSSSGPTVPPPTVNESASCGGLKTLTESSPPSGVTYYWQGTSCGTSTANNASSPYTVSFVGTAACSGAATYFVRARSDAGCWSASCNSVNVSYPYSAPCGTPAPTTTNACGNQTLTRGTPPTNTTYYWQGTSCGTSTANSAVTYLVTASGDYYIRARDNCSGAWSGCTSIAVTVVPLPTPTITATRPTIFCQGDSTILDAGSGYKNYLWSDNSTAQTLVARNNGKYWVKVTDANGCQGADTVNVTVNPLPTPTITASGPTTFCQGDSVLLTATAATSYLWLPTKDTTQKITVKTSGSDSVTVTDANGCKGTSPAIKITVNPNPTPVINGPTTFCLGDSVLLDAGGSYSTYSWTPPSGNIKSVTVKTSGSFTVQVTDANGCKGTSLPLTVTVAPNLNMIITGITEICQGDSTTLTAAGAVRYVWNTGNSKDTSNQLTVKPSTNTTYIVSGTNQSGSCKGADTVTVTVNPLPTANVGLDLKMCEGEKVVLNSSGNTSYSYSWTPTTPPTLNDSNSVSPVASPQTTTTYMAMITDNKNCVAYDTVTVTVNPLPSVDAGTDVTITSEESALLKAVSSSQGTLIWSPATGLSCTDCQSTTANPQQTTRYHVSLTDSNGCKASDSVVVYKTCGDLYIPNAFTPNHDNKNEVFTVEQTGFTKINMYIFDRWGEQVYETDSFDKPWNGKVGDVEAQQDVYVYLVYAWDCSEQKHKYIGHVTLIR